MILPQLYPLDISLLSIVSRSSVVENKSANQHTRRQQTPRRLLSDKAIQEEQRMKVQPNPCQVVAAAEIAALLPSKGALVDVVDALAAPVGVVPIARVGFPVAVRRGLFVAVHVSELVPGPTEVQY